MGSMESLRDRIEELARHIPLLAHRSRIVKWRPCLWHGIAVVLMVLCLVGLALQSATAQPELERRVRELEINVDDLERTVRFLENDLRVIQAALNNVNARVRALEAGNVNARVEALENTFRPVTRVGNELVITGANLRIVNGLNATATMNSTGNLIVGYNEPRGDGTDITTGSHNVVVGREHNFSRFGGLVVGQRNEISGDFCSVSGGIENTASGFGASVSGSFQNTASGDFSLVSGGRANMASGFGASVSGGRENTASGILASVSGGSSNTASGGGASVSGGSDRTAPGDSDWAAGGLFQEF